MECMPYICLIKLIKSIITMAKLTLKNKNVRFFDNPERIFRMDYIHIYGNGKVDMAGTTPEGAEVDNVWSKIGEFQAWDFNAPTPEL